VHGGGTAWYSESHKSDWGPPHYLPTLHWAKVVLLGTGIEGKNDDHAWVG